MVARLMPVSYDTLASKSYMQLVNAESTRLQVDVVQRRFSKQAPVMMLDDVLLRCAPDVTRIDNVSKQGYILSTPVYSVRKLEFVFYHHVVPIRDMVYVIEHDHDLSFADNVLIMCAQMRYEVINYVDAKFFSLYEKIIAGSRVMHEHELMANCLKVFLEYDACDRLLILSGDVETNPGPTFNTNNMEVQALKFGDHHFNLSRVCVIRNITLPLDDIEFSNLKSLFSIDINLSVFTAYEPISPLNEATLEYNSILSNPADLNALNDILDEYTQPRIPYAQFVNLAYTTGMNTVLFDVDANKAFLIRMMNVDYALCYLISDKFVNECSVPYQCSVTDELKFTSIRRVELSSTVSNLLFSGEMLSFVNVPRRLRPEKLEYCIINVYDYSANSMCQLQIEQRWISDDRTVDHTRSDMIKLKSEIHPPRPNYHVVGNYTVDTVKGYAHKNVSAFNLKFPNAISLPYYEKSVYQNDNIGQGRYLFTQSYAGIIIINVDSYDDDKLMFAQVYNAMPKRLFSEYAYNTNSVFCVHRTYIELNESDKLVTGVITYNILLNNSRVPIRLFATLSTLERIYQTLQPISVYSIRKSVDTNAYEFNIISNGGLIISGDDILTINATYDDFITSTLGDSINKLLYEFDLMCLVALRRINVPNARRLLDDVSTKIIIARQTQQPLKGILQFSQNEFKLIVPTYSVISNVSKDTLECGLPLYVRNSLAPRINRRFQSVRMEQTAPMDKALSTLCSFTLNCKATFGISMVGHYLVALPCGILSMVDNPLLHRHTCTLKYHGFNITTRACIHNSFDCTHQGCNTIYSNNLFAQKCASMHIE